MRIAYIGAGAAGTICANCLKDNALAAALMRLGHEVVLLPAYTPLLTDEEDVSDRRIVFGGINLYLQSRFSFFRNSGALDRLLDHPRLLGWASKFAVDTDPANLGAMTRDTFRGASGPYSREMAKLMDMLTEIRPEIVHLTNSMLACMAEPVKKKFGVPVVCSLQGEADFLNGLTEPHRSECRDLIRRHADNIDLFVPSCNDQAEALAPILGGILDRTETVLPGISIAGFGSRRPRASDRFHVGFLARVARNKGLALLARAVRELRRARPDLDVRLRVAGWRARQTQPYIDSLRERFGFEDVGYLSRDRKIEFLRGLDAFSVPTDYRAAKGLYVLEALAAGVPVVQPRIGVFPELVSATGGGLTFAPGDSHDLAGMLKQLADDPKEAGRMGIRGRDAVLRRFDSDRMARETLELYRRIAPSDKGAGRSED